MRLRGGVSSAHAQLKPFIEPQAIFLALEVGVVGKYSNAMFLLQFIQSGNNVGEEVDTQPLRKRRHMGMALVGVEIG